jgi:nitronate monooxygenase
MDPAELPEGSKQTMDFGKADKTGAKAWKDIWGAGQGVGNIDDVLPARDVVLRMEAEYRSALERVGASN